MKQKILNSALAWREFLFSDARLHERGRQLLASGAVDLDDEPERNGHLVMLAAFEGFLEQAIADLRPADREDLKNLTRMQ